VDKGASWREVTVDSVMAWWRTDSSHTASISIKTSLVAVLTHEQKSQEAVRSAATKMFDRINTSNPKALNNSFKGKAATAEIDTRSNSNKKGEGQQTSIFVTAKKAIASRKHRSEIQNAKKQ
jgi:hypothetical protein